jgi:hypothetical protein
MKGFFKENCFFPKQLIWPDIPLGNNPEPSETKITLATKTKETTDGFLICPDAKPSENVITGFDRLGMIKISKGGKDIRVIAYSPGKETSEEEAVGILKKRMIPEEGVVDNLIAEIPDILWIFNNKRNWRRNYRGVVIASSDENSFVEYVRGEIRFRKI